METQELLSQFTSAAIVVYALQWIKGAGWCQWLTMETESLNRVVAAIAAAGSAIGIHAAYDTTGGVLTISGLTLAGVIHGVWHWANQFALQQLAFDAVVKPKKQPEPEQVW